MWTSLSSKDNMIAEIFKVALELEEPWELTHIEWVNVSSGYPLLRTL